MLTMVLVIINRCYGGFEFSKEQLDEYCRRTGVSECESDDHDLRFDPVMIVRAPERSGLIDFCICDP